MLELEPGSSFGSPSLAALRRALLGRHMLLRLDCSYTQVDEELAAELIGPGCLAALCQWQPEGEPVEPALPAEEAEAAIPAEVPVAAEAKASKGDRPSPPMVHIISFTKCS